MPTKVEFTPIDLRGAAEIYSIRMDGERDSEFNKFLILYRSSEDPYIQDDFLRIAEAIKKISEDGALERNFRVEGNFSDRVYAIPLSILRRDKSKHGTLRLYCLRISDRLLILGGGGVKTTDTYEEDAVLSEAVRLLQEVDRKLMALDQEGTDIEKDITNITVYIE